MSIGKSAWKHWHVGQQNVALNSKMHFTCNEGLANQQSEGRTSQLIAVSTNTSAPPAIEQTNHLASLGYTMAALSVL